MFNFMKYTWLIPAIVFSTIFVACDDEGDVEPAGDPIASFQIVPNESNFLEVSFINVSENATSYTWDFGDGNTSTEVSPTHTYTEAGEYTVALTASNDAGVSDDRTEPVSIVDPLASQRTLFGDNGKTWMLLNDVSGGNFPFVVGPVARNEIWWSFGGAQPLCERTCILDDEYTFTPDGKMERNLNGDFWGEGGVWPEELVGCFDVSNAANWVNSAGDDLTAWNSGTFDFTYNPSGETPTLTVSGLGAYVGLSKLGSTAEFNVPQEEVVYTVAKIVDAAVDTLVLETKLIDTDGVEFGYWAVTLVSYDDPGMRATVEECTPEEPAPCELDQVTPSDLFNTFASTDAADVAMLVPTESDVTLNVGVDDPADPTAAKVGEYVRGTAAFADLKFEMANDVLLSNFSTVSVDIYFPGSNDYTGALSDQVDIFMADASCDTEFWTQWSLVVNTDEKPRDEWVTITFDLGDAATRDDIDLFGIKIGGENHAVDATFYIRNFKFE